MTRHAGAPRSGHPRLCRAELSPHLVSMYINCALNLNTAPLIKGHTLRGTPAGSHTPLRLVTEARAEARNMPTDHLLSSISTNARAAIAVLRAGSVAGGRAEQAKSGVGAMNMEVRGPPLTGVVAR